MRIPLIAGNWKMNGGLASNAELLNGILAGAKGLAAEMAVCVPAPYLAQVQAALAGSGVNWGAQDVSVHDSGAYTGEVSVAMLRDFGCRYVIVGHSERRSYHGETDALIAQKAVRAMAGGLTPIVCVGETLQEREQGLTDAVVTRQLAPVLAAAGADLARIVIAYEPVWAIGTGKTASPAQAQAVHAFIRGRLADWCSADVAARTTILYGGSVKPQNAAELFGQADIDGGLIGGASLVAGDFLAIVAASAS